jgi:hypothetical protein
MQTTTRYQKSKRTIADYPHDLLKKPTSKKLGAAGKLVTKGRLKGAEVFTLTLTERETCPKSCGHWSDCYGNNMPFAHRLEHGPELEQALLREVNTKCEKAAKKGRKVLVRLHVLGDFYSVRYANLWGFLLSKHENLNVWGYTHVTENDNKNLYTVLKNMRVEFGSRWAVRWSDQVNESFSANSEEIQKPVKGKAIVCPEQEGKTLACTTCALCWDKENVQIIFKTH